MKWWYRFWRWLIEHVVVLPKEPEATQAKQADRKGVIVGLRWWLR